jgi:hypothetical protein
MLRKTVFIMMLLTAICLGGGAAVSFHEPLYQGFSPTERFHFYMHCHEGLLRLYAFGCEEPAVMVPRRDASQIEFLRASDRRLIQLLRHASPTGIEPYELIWRRPLSRRAGSVAVTMYGLRCRAGLPVALLIVLPAVGVVVDRAWMRIQHKRKRRGLCAECGYDLTGNTTGVCSECGGAAVRVTES